MVIFNGFWAGFISGAVVLLAVFTGYSMIVTTFEARTQANLSEYLDTLNEAAKENIEKMKGESNESDD